MPFNPADKPVRIRAAELEDAPAIARVRVESWRTTYCGLLSDQYLAEMDVEYYTQNWESILAAGSSQGYAFVAENQHGEIVGFAFGGPERTLHRDYRGEIYAIYLLQEYQQQGLGRRLVAAVVHCLLDEGIEDMLIWVLAANPATRFYQALGGKRVIESEISLGNKMYKQIAYGYSNIRPLALPAEEI